MSAEKGEESRNLFSAPDFFNQEAFPLYLLTTFGGVLPLFFFLSFFSPENYMISLKELIFC